MELTFTERRLLRAYAYEDVFARMEDQGWDVVKIGTGPRYPACFVFYHSDKSDAKLFRAPGRDVVYQEQDFTSALAANNFCERRGVVLGEERKTIDILAERVFA
tara:strand:- start:330 stop:641 length:312 start_codon:yes stop_codon:yes gene_type:complete